MMMIFTGICVGVLIGAVLGAIGMYLFIKDAEIEKVMERQAEDDIPLEDPWDADSLDDIMKQEDIHYGEF